MFDLSKMTPQEIREAIVQATIYGYLPTEGEFSVEAVQEAIYKVIIHDTVPETWTRVEQDDGEIVGLRRIVIEGGEEQIECRPWSEVSNC